MSPKNKDCIELSIIIPNFQSSDLLNDLINSILSSKLSVSFEINVVNHGYIDDLERCRAKFTKVKYMNTGTIHGYAKPCNIGWRASCGKYLLFLNADTIIEPGTINDMVSELDKHPGWGIIAPRTKVYHKDMDLFVTYIEAPSPIEIALDHTFFSKIGGIFPMVRKTWRNYLSKLGEDGTPISVPSVCGAIMMVRRSMFEALGGFCEDFISGYDDIDLCSRAKKHGYDVILLPNLEAFHYCARIRRRFYGKDPSSEFWRSQNNMHLKYIHNNYGYIPYLLLKLFLRLNDIFIDIFNDSRGARNTNLYYLKDLVPLESIILSWHDEAKKDINKFILEISHSRLFYSKMHTIIEDKQFEMNRELLEGMLPKRYYWRVFGMINNRPILKPIKVGWFFPYKKESA